MHFLKLTNKCILLCLFLFILLFLIVTKSRFSQHLFNIQNILQSRGNILDGCQYVYIDMGTNIGIQIRKLYEPHLYPDAPVLTFFKDLFGNRTNEVCSIGFEANPLHTDYLKEFENYCWQRNWRVKIFTSLAVSVRRGNLTFFTEPGNEQNNQWGASLEKTLTTQNGSITVPSIDIVAWYKNTVLTRNIPSTSGESRIMMKHDLEGHDSTVLTDFILGGVFCTIDFIYGEHLNKEFYQSIAEIQRYSKSCKTKLVDKDDELYYNIRHPFIVSGSENTTATI